MVQKLGRVLRDFARQNANIIGMIHLGASPGTPNYANNVQDVIKKAEYEANLYKEAGVDGVIIENMHDIPYVHAADVGPEVVSMATMACAHVRKVLPSLPVGVQILAGANQHALAVALAADLDFIRAEGFVFSHVADEGLMNACAGPLLRYRRHIGAEHIKILTDIKKKHSAHSITSDVSIKETAQAAQFFLSDGVILTGSSTSEPANIQELQEVCENVSIPVFVGSGVTKDNFLQYSSAYGLIIGSYFKDGHHWKNDVDPRTLGDFMDHVRHVLNVR